MTTHQRSLSVTSTLALAIAGFVVPGSAFAHGDHPRDITLHVSDAYDSCHFDLHSELTLDQFEEFAAEAGQIARFRQLAGAATLGAGNFEINLGEQIVFLDDSKGAWNNTMSHPDDEHYLGEELPMPFLMFRLGITDAVDIEAYGTLNPQSNYGLVGIASKIRILEQSDDMPIALAFRPSVSGLIGPSEVTAANVSFDFSVSRDFGGIAPFVGVGLSNTAVAETSDDTNVGHAFASRPVGYAGVDFNWRFLTAGVQAELSDLTIVSFRAGGRI